MSVNVDVYGKSSLTKTRGIRTPAHNRRRRAHKGKARGSFALAVRQAVLSMAEKKNVRYTPNATLDLANAVNTGSPGFSDNVITLTPSSGTYTIAQGSTQGTRIGNEVRVNKVDLRLQVFPAPYNATSNTIPMPQVIIGYIFGMKGINVALSNAQFTTSVTGDFFDNGASSSGFQGNIVDYMGIPNKDQVIIYKRFVMKLGAASYTSNTGQQANQFSFTNNDFKMCCLKTIDLTRYFPKVIKFNDTGTPSLTKQLYCVLSPVDADGGANADGAAALPCLWNYIINLYYTDM